jgi:hypothetical protein
VACPSQISMSCTCCVPLLVPWPSAAAIYHPAATLLASVHRVPGSSSADFTSMPALSEGIPLPQATSAPDHKGAAAPNSRFRVAATRLMGEQCSASAAQPQQGPATASRSTSTSPTAGANDATSPAPARPEAQQQQQQQQQRMAVKRPEGTTTLRVVRTREAAAKVGWHQAHRPHMRAAIGSVLLEDGAPAVSQGPRARTALSRISRQPPGLLPLYPWA